MSLLSRIKGAFARGILEAITDQGFEVSLLSGEKMTEAEHLQEFGHASKPPKGSYSIAGFIGGDRNNPTILLVEHPDHKPDDLEDGETCVYNAHDMQIYLRENGEVRIEGGGFTKLIVDGDVMVTGRIDADGEIESQSDCISAGISGNSHVHGGVQSGGSNTAGPQ